MTTLTFPGCLDPVDEANIDLHGTETERTLLELLREARDENCHLLERLEELE